MINNSYLLGLFGGSGIAAGDFGGVVAPPRQRQPTPPWSTSVQATPQSDLVRAALGGRKLINESAIRLDATGGSADYRTLFSLYNGLDTLAAIVNRSQAKGLASTELNLLQRRFETGMAEITSYLSTTRLQDVRVVTGTAAATAKTTAGVPRDRPNFVTAPIHEGAIDTPVAAFQGDVAFDITVARTANPTQTLRIDLADMGSTPRTLDAVNSFINDKLQAAGLETRFGREQVAQEARTVQVGGRTVTLPSGPDRWSLVVRGTSVETVSFAPVQAADAVYVAQSVGGTAPGQLLKFSADTTTVPGAARPGETQWVDGRVSQSALPAGVAAVRASAIGPDGSLWLVADVEDEALAGQPVKGERDVALLKYDPSGRLVASRALGAADTASGYAIAIAADGKVAVAGAVTGALEPGRAVVDSAASDSFVTVFDAAGLELWTQRRGARAADEATGVAFGADGTVYVSGRAASAMPGAASVGGWDSYVESFKASQRYPGAPFTAVATSIRQFGTGGEDTVSAMTVSGSDLYTAGVESGRAVVRRFTLDAAGTPTLAATRDLGLMSGEIAGIAVEGGRVIVAGATRNAALDAGTVVEPHNGGMDAFAASLAADLTADPGDWVSYYGGAGEDGAADVKVHNGAIWLTGVADRPFNAKPEDPTRAYLARLDAGTGAVVSATTWAGDGGQASPATLAVGGGGASVLDRLGLPTGTIAQSDSRLLTAATSLRVGDRFSVSLGDGSRARTVTIDARDTLQTLSRKIEQASQRRLIVSVTTGDDGIQRLNLRPRDPERGAVLSSGESGRDALAGLGLAPGYIGATSGDDVVRTFGLGLTSDLTLRDADTRKAAGETILKALSQIRAAYRALAPESTTPRVTGQAPAYLQAQLANYQAALNRLTGGG
ncbi:MAG TPA: transcriptional regulator [Brevundimonas sp.]|uniref:transcriptional regulator n=1 Tax=Brevundimonas sp. TaxID=1871086 RepID=UPI002E0F4D5A|nr:transcriptional regulator [Brevundimonas sp.]